MNVSPTEAEESLMAIQNITRKTRHSLANSGVFITLIVTGIVWLVGFTCQQFLPPEIVGYVWGVSSIVGSITAMLLGSRLGRRVRSPLTAPMVKRVSIFWVFLVFFCLATMAAAWPLDGKQLSLIVVLFIMAGQWSMGLLFSYSSSWWALPVAALALAGYFLLPGYFFLWMGVLGGGGMIALGVTIRTRW
jgi:hypothetical protein